jgi:hypothetical protein
MHRVLGLILAATVALPAACGAGGDGRTGADGGARSGDIIEAATTSPDTAAPDDGGDGGAGTFTNVCPSAEQVSGQLGLPMTLSQQGVGARVVNLVPEFGCDYIPAEEAEISVLGNRNRYDDVEAVDYEMDVSELDDSGFTAAGPFDTERTLDLGDRGYMSSRIHERQDGQGYVVHAEYGARLGARYCTVVVDVGRAPEPVLTPAQDAVGMSVLTALCDR